MKRKDPAKKTIASWAKRAGVGVLAALLMATVTSFTFSNAGTAASAEPSETDVRVVPTTKILAIGSFLPKATEDVWKPILPSEARATAQLYFTGKIDQWFVKQDKSGVVFLLNVTDTNEAHELLDKLPLGKAGLMEFQLIPLGPLGPLRAIMTMSEPAN